MSEVIKGLTNDLLWKNIYKFSSKWNLAIICVAIPCYVREQLKRDFIKAYPDKDFDAEWEICVKE